jgi:hypothetical protein
MLTALLRKASGTQMRFLSLTGLVIGQIVLSRAIGTVAGVRIRPFGVRRLKPAAFKAGVELPHSIRRPALDLPMAAIRHRRVTCDVGLSSEGEELQAVPAAIRMEQKIRETALGPWA